MPDETRPVVLVASHDPLVVRLTRLQLAEEGFRPLTASSGRETLSEVAAGSPDLVIVAEHLPDVSGLDLIPQVRARGPLPVILLTEGTDVRSRLRGFERGADDCMPRQFNPEELTARVRAVLRRYRRPPGPTERDVIRVGDLAIDLGRRTVRRRGLTVLLTGGEWRLLEVLCRSHGRVLSTDELLRQAWGAEFAGEVQLLRTWISRLRRRLEPDGQRPSIIRNYPGFGYALEIDDPAGPDLPPADPAGRTP